MKIVVDIPEVMYDWLVNGFPDEDDFEKCYESIIKGTPLPKGHGKLIDINPIMEYLFRPYSNEESYTNIDLERIFRNATTIIEADRVEKEEKMNCDDCLYTDIADWKKDGNTERLKPVLWCERYNKLCLDVIDCKYTAESEDKNEDRTRI